MNTTTANQALIQQIDLGIAHEAYCEVFNWIETLQSTAHWLDLPVEIRKAVCTVHSLSGLAADQIEPLV